jgi:hypothetical protein
MKVKVFRIIATGAIALCAALPWAGAASVNVAAAPQLHSVHQADVPVACSSSLPRGCVWG